MDLNCDKEVCGTCKDWKGKREKCEGGIFKVSPSARGMCQKRAKAKPPHGGCDEWHKSEEESDG